MEGKRVVFTGGGTGGHVYPALPLIEKLLEQGYSILWIGSYKGIERRIVGSWEVEYRPISTGKLRRYFSLANFIDLFKIFWGFCQSLALLRVYRPKLLFSKGGFVTVPPVLAASFWRIPSYTHDSDFKPGLATRINHRFTRRTFVAYQESLSFLERASGKGSSKVVVTGNPVRREFFNPPEGGQWEARLGRRPLLLILGGSTGAWEVNALVKPLLPRLRKNFVVVHQMGEALYEGEGEEDYYPLAYIHEDLPWLLNRAELLISRAGAGSLWEAAATWTPAILIPLVKGSRGDQVANAAVFRDRGMALILEGEGAGEKRSEALWGLVCSLLDDPEKWGKMKKCCGGFSASGASERILPYLTGEGGYHGS